MDLRRSPLSLRTLRSSRGLAEVWDDVISAIGDGESQVRSFWGTWRYKAKEQYR